MKSGAKPIHAPAADSHVVLQRERTLQRPRGMTHEEAAALARRAQSGDTEARRDLAEAHMAVVQCVASDFEEKGEARQDLRQELHLAMLEDVIPRFDPTRGVPFRSWAFNRLRHVATRETRRTWRSYRLWAQEGVDGVDSSVEAAPELPDHDRSDAIERLLKRALAENRLRQVEADAFRLRLSGARAARQRRSWVTHARP